MRTACSMTATHQDAEDLVQETFARILARPRQIGHRADQRYLLRALRNTWIDAHRARRARPVAVGADALDAVAARSGDPGGTLLDARLARGAITDLSRNLRAAIVAVDVLGLSYRDAARALRIPQGTLQSRLSRARDRVSSKLLAY